MLGPVIPEPPKYAIATRLMAVLGDRFIGRKLMWKAPKTFGHPQTPLRHASTRTVVLL